MYTVKKYKINNTSLLKFLLIGFWFFFGIVKAQIYQLQKDAEFINNFQIELIGEKHLLFISDGGFVTIPTQNITDSDKVIIIDKDSNTNYSLSKEELRIKDSILYFSTGKLIEAITLTNKKKEEMRIGIDDKGSSSKLYIQPDIARIVEIPQNSLYIGRKIKKIKYYFSGGKHPVSGERINKNDTEIIALMYTCEKADCKDPKFILPETEIHFTENNKYLEVDLGHRNIIIDESFKNIYVGFISLGNFVVKQKKADKINDNKCYNTGAKLEYYRLATHKCPIISLVIE